MAAKLKEVVKLKQLEHLGLLSTKVTKAGVAEVQHPSRLRVVTQSSPLKSRNALAILMHVQKKRVAESVLEQAWREEQGGGHLVWLGIHWLDLAQFVAGAEITEVAGFIANVGGQPIDIEDSATATLRFDNGALGTMTSGYYLKRGYHSHIKIWGSEGWLHLQQMLDKPLHWISNKGDQAGKVQEWKGNRQPRGYTPYVRACVETCANDTDPPINNADSLRAVKVVYSIYEAAAKGKTVRVD